MPGGAVSGRRRKPGEMNGKSANLNNCLQQIYPDDCAIPPNEVICIFDADQVPSQALKTSCPTTIHSFEPTARTAAF